LQAAAHRLRKESIGWPARRPRQTVLVRERDFNPQTMVWAESPLEGEGMIPRCGAREEE